jgi:hypothetical protein
MTPGRSIAPSTTGCPKTRSTGACVAGDEHLRALGHDVGDHQRVEECRAPRAAAQLVEQLVAAVEHRVAHRLDLRDDEALALADGVLLRVARDDRLRVDLGDVGRCLEHLAPERGGVERRGRARGTRPAAWSRSVVVGELRITGVRQHRAEQRDRRRPRRLHAVVAEALDDERRGRADRVERRPTGIGRLDRADVVVVEDLDDLACSTPTTLWACSAWSTSSTRRGSGESSSACVTTPIGRRAPSTATAAR